MKKQKTEKRTHFAIRLCEIKDYREFFARYLGHGTKFSGKIVMVILGCLIRLGGLCINSMWPVGFQNRNQTENNNRLLGKCIKTARRGDTTGCYGERSERKGLFF